MPKNKLLFLSSAFLLLLMIIVLAEETQTAETIETQTTEAAPTATAGVSPDNTILWRLEVFFEDALVGISYNREEKVAKALKHATERLAEVEKMLRWKKTAAAEKARNKHEATLEKVQIYLEKLEYKDKAKELEKEYDTEEVVKSSEEQSKAWKKIIETNAELDEEQQTIAEQLFEKAEEAQAQFHATLEKKKEETKLAIKANGVSETELETLERAIKDKIKNALKEQQDEKGENVEEVLETEEIITEENEPKKNQTESNASNTLEEKTETQKATGEKTTGETTIIEDTSSQSWIKVEGDLTPDQMQNVLQIYEELRQEDTEAEIEIIVSEASAGIWKIEKEVDGRLTKKQEEYVETLLASLSENAHYMQIKIKYTSEDATGNVFEGEADNGIATTVVIG